MQMFLRRYVLLLLLAMVMPIFVVACGGAPSTPETGSESGDAAEQAAAPPTVDPVAADEEGSLVEEEPAAEEPAPEEPAAEEPVEEPVEEPAPEEPIAEAPVEEPADDETENGPEVPASEMQFVDPVYVEGDFSLDGSTIVMPMVDRLVGEFSDEGYIDIAEISSAGTAPGLESFCAGESDIAMASRPINDEERAMCQENGREPMEFGIGGDALVIIVNSENEVVSDVTMDQLAQLFGGATTWDEINSDWPAEDILRFLPGENTDAMTVFAEAMTGGDSASVTGAANTQIFEDSAEIVNNVESTPNGIGFLSYTDYILDKDRVKLVTIDGMEPDAGNVVSGEYPLSSPLLLYTSASVMQEKPQVAGFINYALLTINNVVFDQGYFPPTDDMLNQGKEQWVSVNQN